jgi:enamine deaminase RidA (YjgF/YER057c/UK114 family)
MTTYHVAIVGGGIGGLYAAYRLKQAWQNQRDQVKKHLGIEDQRPLTIAIIERNPLVLGGRIRIADLPTPHGSVRAELGAMRVTTRHLLARNLFKELGIGTVPFEGEGFSEHFYLRGKHFDLTDIEQGSSAFPYAVSDHEKGRRPGALVAQVLEATLKDLSLDDTATAPMLLILEKLRSETARRALTHDEWCTIQEHGLLTGNVHLMNIGMWNLIHHYLSPEAASFVEGGFGYESIIGNWNVSDAIPWFIADFSPAQRYDAVEGSFFRVIETLVSAITEPGGDFRCEIVKGARVVGLSKAEDHYRIRISERNDDDLILETPTEISTKSVFLALPRRALEGVDIDWLTADQRDDWAANLASVRSHRLVKIVQGYRKAWWRGDGRRGAASRTFTDLPLRQVYYFDREWLEERQRYRDLDGGESPVGRRDIEGIVVAYLDGHYAAFWRFITAVQRLRSRPTNVPREEQKRDWFGERVSAWPEPDLEEVQRRSVGQWTPQQRAAYLYFNRYGLYERASAKMKHILGLLHQQPHGTPRANIPDPVAGAYTFWDDFSDDTLSGAGWHTWEPGISSEAVMQYMARPFGDDRVFVCGEAFSSEQGWIEGALKSVERILYGFDVLLPGETWDAAASHRAKRTSDLILDHVGVHARKPEKSPAVTPLFSGHRSVAVGSHDMVFLAGKIGIDADATERASFEEETRRALAALFEEIASADGEPADIVSVRAFLRSMDDYDDFNRVYNESFRGLSTKPPVRTAIAVNGLPRGARVEVDAIAVIARRI